MAQSGGNGRDRSKGQEVGERRGSTKGGGGVGPGEMWGLEAAVEERWEGVLLVRRGRRQRSGV
jgi:hypothetical protein